MDVSGLDRNYTYRDISATHTYTYGSTTLDFYYDQAGRPYALKHNGTTYYYILNLQGDVMALVNASGTEAAAYTYDPWGKVLTATGTMASINPLRYRGYYQDSETGFYYLQSRYYDPAIRRFLNADGYASTGQGILGHNMFAYCNNNPVNMIDSTGDIALLTCVIIGAVVGLFVGGGVGACISYKKYKEVKWQYVLIGAVAGAAIGGACGYAIGLAIGASVTTAGTAKAFSETFKITAKISKQLSKRGWTEELIKETILNNIGREAINKATGNAATAYFTSSGGYVVIDNVTKEIIQISNLYDPNWVIDATIKLLTGDVFIK